MINFYYEYELETLAEEQMRLWLHAVITAEGCSEGELNFIFCDDKYLLEINKEFLNHDTYTDIITFDNSVGKKVHGEVYIGVDQVYRNAEIYKTTRQEELRRVMVHGILHLCGYKDKTKEESMIMRNKEDEKLKLFHVEH